MKLLMMIIFGMIVLLILLTLAAKLGEYFFERKVKQEIDTMFKEYPAKEGKIITEKDLQKLPPPIQKWMKNSGVTGRSQPYKLRLEQLAEMRLKPDQNWMPAMATQHFRLDEPSFIWQVKVKMLPLIYFTGRDKLARGKGNMLIKLLALIPVVDAGGEEIDLGTMLRYLAEMVWFPSTAINPNIDWQQLDDSTVRATLKDPEQSVQGTFYFDEQGFPTRFIAKRYREIQGNYELCDWQINIEKYGEFEGYKIPVQGEVTWKLPEADFTWFRFQIISADYE